MSGGLPDQAGLSARLDRMRSEGALPVLLLDELEGFALGRDEFDHDFFAALRARSRQGLWIVTASEHSPSQITDPPGPTSPFSNTFALLTLGPCTEADATDFVTLRRLGLPPFTPEEQSAILAFARGHPLALQVACWHVVESRPFKESLATVLRKANDPMETILPGWRGRPA